MTFTTSEILKAVFMDHMSMRLSKFWFDAPNKPDNVRELNQAFTASILQNAEKSWERHVDNTCSLEFIVYAARAEAYCFVLSFDGQKLVTI